MRTSDPTHPTWVGAVSGDIEINNVDVDVDV